MDENLLSLAGRERCAGHDVLTPRLEAAAETLGVIYHRFTILENAERPERLRKPRSEINVSLRPPALDKTHARDGAFVGKTHVGPWTLPSETMVEIYENV